MTRTPYLPTARQTNYLLTAGFLALGYALYLRYLVIEQPTVGIACQTGLATWLCTVRGAVIPLFQHSVFGWTALAVAALHLVRPSGVLFGAGLAAAAFGVVLYNAGLAGLAAAVLMLGFARPHVASD